MMEKELIRLRQAESDLQVQVSVQNKLIEQQQEHIDLLEKQNYLQEQRITDLAGEVKIWQNQLGKNSHSTYPVPPSRHLSIRRFPSSPVAIILILLVLCLLGTVSIGIFVTATGHLPKQQDTSQRSSASPVSSTTVLSGSTASAQGSSTSPVSSATVSVGSTASSHVSSSSIALNKSISLNISSLNIQTTAISCPVDQWLSSNKMSYSGGNVVLTNKNASFDVGTLSRLTASLDKNDPSLLPNGFAAVLGAFVTHSFAQCSSIWQMTNTSQNVIQVQQVALVYAVDALPNTYHYNLINLCSLHVETNFCGGQRGSGGGGPVYTFKLAAKSSGTTVYSSNTQPFSIRAGQTVPIELLFNPADILNPSYIYSIIPEITLSPSSQPRQLPQLTSRVAFFDNSSASCYQLKSNNTFVQDNSLNIPTTESGNGVGFIADCV